MPSTTGMSAGAASSKHMGMDYDDQDGRVLPAFKQAPGLIEPVNVGTRANRASTYRPAGPRHLGPSTLAVVDDHRLSAPALVHPREEDLPGTRALRVGAPTPNRDSNRVTAVTSRGRAWPNGRPGRSPHRYSDSRGQNPSRKSR